MTIYLATDHRGFELKEKIKEQLLADGHDVTDVGAQAYDPDDDYPTFALKALRAMGDSDRAILLCGSGHGMEMIANKFKNIRAIMGFNETVVQQGREHEDANVLVIPADWITADMVPALLTTFLTTPFSNKDRHVRRLMAFEDLGCDR